MSVLLEPVALGELQLANRIVMVSMTRSDAFALARRHSPHALILNDGFDGPSASAALASGEGTTVSFGRHFIANPDRVKRLKRCLALRRFDRKTFYTPGSAGYPDYPDYQAIAQEMAQ